jgi:hypothetical protein
MQGLELFRQQFGRMPDLVLLQSAFWELATMWKEDTKNGSRDPHVLSDRALPQSYIDEYSADVTGLLQCSEPWLVDHAVYCCCLI